MLKRCAIVLIALSPMALGAQAKPAADASVFAKVNGTVISQAEFSLALRAEMKRKFYHGKVPEHELALFQREVGDQLVERELLYEEAKRRGLRPDEQRVTRHLQGYDARVSRNSPKWPIHRDKVLKDLRRQLEIRSMIEQVAAQVQDVGEPTERELLEYYARTPEKFTEPQRMKLSVILLRVAPSAGRVAWEAAQQEAEKLVVRLRAGADFGELARLHSGDPSAEKGGDMGYVHRGMLGEAAQKVLDETETGKISEPAMLLDGVAVFRLVDRPRPALQRFDTVRERALALWKRWRKDEVWRVFLDRLRDGATVVVNEVHYLPLSKSGVAKH